MRARRKFLAMLLATSMVLGSSIPALAAGGEQSDLGGKTVSGNSTVVDTGGDVIKVKLPTNLDLVLDAEGAYGAAMNNGGSLSNANMSELDAYKGKILSKEKLEVNNLSSMPITVSVEFKAVKTGTATVNYAASANAVENADGSFNVWLAAVPSTADIKGNLSANYATNGRGFNFDDSTTSANAIKVYLEAPEYVVTGTTSGSFNKTIKDGDLGHGQAFDIVGTVNSQADWSAREGGFGEAAGTNSKLSVDAKFTLAKATTADKTAFDAAADAGYPYGCITATSSNLVDTGAAAAAKAPSIATTGTYTKATGKVEVAVDLGTGSKATTLEKACFGSAPAPTTEFDSSAAVVNSKFTGTVPSGVKSGWSSKANGTFVYAKIVLADGTEQEVKLTVQ